MVTDVVTIDFGMEKTFLAGPENRAIVCAVDDFALQWEHASPLVLHGPPMSGKSHLARGIAIRWQSSRPEDKVLTLTGSDYAREFAQACKADTVDMFSQRVRTCDLLVVDGLDAAAEKVAALEHFSKSVDELDQRGAACVVTMRHLPSQQREFSTHLTSRLSQGLCVGVSLPSVETRQHIIAAAARQRGVVISERSCLRLAQKLNSDALTIENAIAQVVHFQGDDISELDIDDWLQQQNGGQAISLKDITSIVSKLCGVRVTDMKSPSRRTSHVRARGLAMLSGRQRTSLSLGSIGKHFGGRDHTTVMHACEKTTQLINQDQSLRMLWEELLAKLDEHQSSASPVGIDTSSGENLSVPCHSRQ